jgi:carbon monoxide dehydrogenase subunit G
MVQLQGEQSFSEPPAELFRRITDTEFIARCIPDLESVLERTDERLVCRITPGLSFLQAKLNVTIEIIDQKPPHSGRMRLTSKGIGAAVEVESAFELTEQAVQSGPGTRLHWTAEITQTQGLLKSVSRGLLEAAAKKVIGDVWTAVGRELESG